MKFVEESLSSMLSTKVYFWSGQTIVMFFLFSRRHEFRGTETTHKTRG